MMVSCTCSTWRSRDLLRLIEPDESKLSGDVDDVTAEHASRDDRLRLLFLTLLPTLMTSITMAAILFSLRHLHPDWGRGLNPRTLSVIDANVVAFLHFCLEMKIFI